MRFFPLLLALCVAPTVQAAEPEHHADYTADDDHDGIPNWADSDSQDFVLGRVGSHLFNFVVLGAVLVYFGRRPVLDALRDRSHDIRKEVTDAARGRDEARQKHDELTARLSAFEEELRSMRADAEADAKNEEAKLVARAHEEAKRIADASGRNIHEELIRARVALRQDAVDLAVQLAENTLRAQVGAEDQERLARQFLDLLHRAEG